MSNNQILDLELFRDYAEGILDSTVPGSGQQYCLIWLHIAGYGVYRRQRGLFRGRELVDTFGSLLLSHFPSGLVGHAEADGYLVLSEVIDIERTVQDLNDSLSAKYADARVQAEAGVCMIGGADSSRQWPSSGDTYPSGAYGSGANTAGAAHPSGAYGSGANTAGAAGPSGASGGAHTAVRSGDSLTMLVEKAQQALRTISGQPDQHVAFYSESMARAIRLNSYVPLHLQDAMARHDIHVLYQPMVRTLTGQICGAEALARWDDPVMGPIYPGEFVPILEERHMSHLLDACIIDLVAEDLASCGDDGAGAFVPVSVNLSRYDFEDCDIFGVFEKSVQKYHLPRSLFRLELSEGALTVSHDLLKRELGRFRDAGYEVWLDNFGSGYASMSVLGEFRFDTVKFDLHLMRDLRSEERHREVAVMLSYTVNMVKEMKMTTAIVGVETEGEYRWLRQNGFEIQQGYYFCRPQTYGGIIRSERQVEDFRSRDYFSRIGAVQIDNKTTGGDQTHGADPMAIIEKRGEELDILVANQAFGDYVKENGFQSTHDFAVYMNTASGALQERMRDFLASVAGGGKNAPLTIWQGGRIFDLWGSLLARDPEKNSMAVIVHTSVIVASEKHRGQDLRDMLRVIYTVYDRMDLVSRTEHLVERSYLNAPDYGIMIEGRDYDAAVRLYAREIIRRRDQKRFIDFMNESTVDERLQSEKKPMLLQAFEVRRREGGYMYKAFTIIPITTHGRKSMLVAMRDMVQTEAACIR